MPTGLRNAARAFAENEDGATAIEYAMIALMISIVIVGAVRSIGVTLVNIFTLVNNGFAK